MELGCLRLCFYTAFVSLAPGCPKSIISVLRFLDFFGELIRSPAFNPFKVLIPLNCFKPWAVDSQSKSAGIDHRQLAKHPVLFHVRPYNRALNFQLPQSMVSLLMCPIWKPKHVCELQNTHSSPCSLFLLILREPYWLQSISHKLPTSLPPSVFFMLSRNSCFLSIIYPFP